MFILINIYMYVDIYLSHHLNEMSLGNTFYQLNHYLKNEI